MSPRVRDFGDYPADAVYGKKGSALVGAWFEIVWRKA